MLIRVLAASLACAVLCGGAAMAQPVDKSAANQVFARVIANGVSATGKRDGVFKRVTANGVSATGQRDAVFKRVTANGVSATGKRERVSK